MKSPSRSSANPPPSASWPPARKHVQDSRPRYPVARDEGSRIAEAFFIASRSGDTNALRSILAQNVVVRSDGGGKVIAFLNPITGLERVLRMYQGLSRKLSRHPSREMFRPMRINGLPGYVSYERDDVFQTTAFAIEHGRILRSTSPAIPRNCAMSWTHSISGKLTRRSTSRRLQSNGKMVTSCGARARW